jgi:hypothetical protein
MTSSATLFVEKSTSHVAKWPSRSRAKFVAGRQAAPPAGA